MARPPAEVAGLVSTRPAAPASILGTVGVEHDTCVIVIFEGWITREARRYCTRMPARGRDEGWEHVPRTVFNEQRVSDPRILHKCKARKLWTSKIGAGMIPPTQAVPVSRPEVNEEWTIRSPNF